MEKLNEILRELGISKVKLAKYLGVSRQMIYNYLELDDINKWPKEKKVLLLNLLNIKSVDEMETIKVDTDYIMQVEANINALFNEEATSSESADIYQGLSTKNKELLANIIDLIKEDLEDDADTEAYYKYLYLSNFIQAMITSRELKYILGYVAKAAGFVKPLDFVFNEEEQFRFESIMFSAMILYNGRGVSTSKIAESHKRFEEQIEHKMEDKLSRTMELNTIKAQALKELGYTAITEENAAEVLAKITEIEVRTVT
jgi:DNA-binding XRE family transcriptional regulator